ncbi:MAG: AraC family transcriptional regulator [Alphaproteobacteria bacterium]|nr:AraC family transcriptional regulator [Alphaproteobacteria bacterium]MDE2630664.1 AraC family transcriptional regulator [Alphaproteobacteria bacterium]
MTEPTIAAGFARALMELAVSQGADRKLLAERSHIDLEELQDQDNRIPFAKYVALMRAGKELCNDPALALHFGEAFDMDELSIVGLIGQACETAAEAFVQVNRYTRLIADVEVDGAAAGKRLVLSRSAGQIWLIDTRKNPNDFPEMTESSFARMVCMSRRFSDSQLVKAIHVTHATPAYRAEYERIFRVPVVFESDKNALLMTDDSFLTLKNPLPSRYVFGILSERAEALLKSLENSKSTRGRVESLLMPILHTGDASMDTIAGKMELSRQTLYRDLKAEGVTFEKVLDELRHKMALNYLDGKKVSVNETAYLVGFSEPSAFSRAFKRWTGFSPRMMRATTIENNQTGIS